MATGIDMQSTQRGRRGWNGEAATWMATAVLVLVGSVFPVPQWSLAREAAGNFVALLPVIGIAGVLAGWLGVSDWSERAIGWIGSGTVRSVVLASLAGAVTPVCGLGVLPLMATLLRRGLPLAPVMAFWLSSPVTDPAMLAVTAGILGVPFAIAKTLAAFALGLVAGGITAALPAFRGPGHAFMRSDALMQAGCDAGTSPGLVAEIWANVRLVARWLALAVVLEVLVQHVVPNDWIRQVIGSGNVASIPLAAIVGAPLYLDGYAALPLVRGLVAMGMDVGAALALLISGAAVSVYAFVAVVSLVRGRVLVLYVVLAVLGACAAGYVADGLGLRVAVG